LTPRPVDTTPNRDSSPSASPLPPPSQSSWPMMLSEHSVAFICLGFEGGVFVWPGAAHLAVGGFYAAFLPRAADGGASAWVDSLLARSRSLSEVAAILGHSAGEFFRNGQLTVA
jgi:hypothetical protein